jgi:hypothetical protein
MEKTPTKIPAGGNESKLLGGNEGMGGAEATTDILRNVGRALSGGGAVDVSGTVQ